MKITVTNILAAIFSMNAVTVFAATGISPEQAGAGQLMWGFLAFGAVLVIYKTLPAVLVFFSMLKGLFSINPAEATFSPWKGKSR